MPRNTTQVRVLVIDDEKAVREALADSFRSSEVYDFVVVLASSAEECVALEQQADAAFDVCVVDLGFTVTDKSLIGFGLLIGLKYLRHGGIAIVYTGSPTIENAVRSMQLGAADFVVKADRPPDELVQHIEALLERRARDDSVRRRIGEYITAEHENLLQLYQEAASDVVLAIHLDKNGQPTVAATGISRLDALIKYAEAHGARLATIASCVEPSLYMIPAQHRQ